MNALNNNYARMCLCARLDRYHRVDDRHTDSPTAIIAHDEFAIQVLIFFRTRLITAVLACIYARVQMDINNKLVDSPTAIIARGDAAC